MPFGRRNKHLPELTPPPVLEPLPKPKPPKFVTGVTLGFKQIEEAGQEAADNELARLQGSYRTAVDKALVAINNEFGGSMAVGTCSIGYTIADEQLATDEALMTALNDASAEIGKDHIAELLDDTWGTRINKVRARRANKVETATKAETAVEPK